MVRRSERIAQKHKQHHHVTITEPQAPTSQYVEEEEDEEEGWREQAEHCLFRKATDPNDNSDWHTALIDPSLCGSYAYATCCPCAMLLRIQDLMGDGTEDRKDSLGTRCCVGNGLSFLLAAPVLFCLDQFGTRGYDYARDVKVPLNMTPNEMRKEGEEEAPPPQQIMTNNTNFLQRLVAPPTPPAPPSWYDDRHGFQLTDKTSEDFFQCCYCWYYLKEALYVTCVDRACCCSDDLPRFPLEISLLGMLLYPCVICPSTLLFRRTTVDRVRRDHHNTPEIEGWAKSLAVACCCAPCGLVQMHKELQHLNPPVQRRRRRATTTSAAFDGYYYY